MLKPIGSSVVVKREKRKEKTSGGIIVPESVGDAGNVIAEVLAVGAGILLKDGTRVPLEVEVGDKVVLRKMHGEAVGELVTVGNETHYVVDESGLLAVWVDD